MRTLMVLRMLAGGVQRETVREVLGITDRSVSRHFNTIRKAGWDIDVTDTDSATSSYRLARDPRAEGVPQPPDVGLTSASGGARGGSC